MGLNLFAIPSIIKVQSAEPVLTSSSVLWRDSDDNTLYYSDGSLWQTFSSGADAAGFESMLNELALELLRISAEGTLTAPDYNSMFIDYFSDSNGQDNTIDTGNTTAVFATDAYGNGGSSLNATQNTGLQTSYALEKTISSIDSQVIDCTNELKNEGQNITTYCRYRFKYADATPDADVENSHVDAGAPTYTEQTYTNPNPSVEVSSIEIYCYTSNGSYNLYERNDTVNYAPSNKILQTNMQVLSYAPAYIFIHSKDYTLAGTGSLTFDVSFDNGSTWDITTGALNSKIAVTDGSAKNMIIKLNLNGSGVGNTSEIKDYEVMLWSS